jgi:hypothetical protein
MPRSWTSGATVPVILSSNGKKVRKGGIAMRSPVADGKLSQGQCIYDDEHLRRVVSIMRVTIGYSGTVGGRLTSAAISPVSAFRKATRSICSPAVRLSGWISFESQGFWCPP